MTCPRHHSDRQPLEPLEIMTFSNLGCAYKKTGRWEAALQYLQRALQHEVNLECDEIDMAETHLNLCNTYSHLTKHDKAQQHALISIELISSAIQDRQMGEDLTRAHTVLSMAFHDKAQQHALISIELISSAIQDR